MVAPRSFEPPKENIRLEEQGSWPATEHCFDEESVWAVQAALAGGRPLLVRGEPGIGKSQLARAAAAVLKVPFLAHVVDERSERDDLFYRYDAVSRLAQAQVSALVAQTNKRWKEALQERNYFRPGVLWWALNWESARSRAKRYSDHCRPCPEPEHPMDWSQTGNAGAVVLIDEIDKADPSVPNGLLESLGNDGFETAQLGETIRLPEGAERPLVVVTTNEERELPAAFLRRCLVLQLAFPETEAAASEFLLARARVHWSDEAQISDAVLAAAAEMLWGDRSSARAAGLSIPGAAEFLDLARILVRLRPGDEAEQKRVLARVRQFALVKNRPVAP